jgi:hypothetical protein
MRSRHPGSTPLIHKQLLTEEMYYDALDEYGDDEFEAKMGAEAIQDILKEMQLNIKHAQYLLMSYPSIVQDAMVMILNTKYGRLAPLS